MFKKPFDPKLHKEFDSKAKAIAKDMFKNCKTLTLTEEGNEFGVDLVVRKNGIKIGNIEVEVKTDYRWTGPEFPFDDVQALPRKKKYADKTIWLLFNRDYSQHLIARMREVVECNTRERINKYSEGQLETFYIVPKSMVKMNGLPKVIEREDK